MVYCKNCENLIYEKETDMDGECPICGSCNLTYGGRCEVCMADMEESDPAICPDCKEELQRKWQEFKNGLEDSEIEYFLNNIIEWEDFNDTY